MIFQQKIHLTRITKNVQIEQYIVKQWPCFFLSKWSRKKVLSGPTTYMGGGRKGKTTRI